MYLKTRCYTVTQLAVIQLIVVQLFINVCFSSQCLFENVQGGHNICICPVGNKFEPSSKSFVSYCNLFDNQGNPLVFFEVLTT